jgi:GT2 family glycosyltransferase
VTSVLDATVVIPTMNGREVLWHALRALASQVEVGFEVVVVDNGSTDGTVERLPVEWPAVRLVALSTNHGFAAAVNVGIREARAPIVVLLNNDTEVAPRWLVNLIQPLRDDPSVGSCASRILDFTHRSRIDSAGDQLGLVASQIGHGELDGLWFDTPRDVLSACAAAAAYRRDVLETIGGFDEWHFAYLEDVDVGIRLQLAGYRCRYVPEAVVYHHGSLTARRSNAFRLFLLLRNSWAIFVRYMPLERLVFGFPLMLLVPFVAVARERQSPMVAVRALGAVLRALPRLVRERAVASRARRISSTRFRSLLAHPLARQRRWRSAG